MSDSFWCDPAQLTRDLLKFCFSDDSHGYGRHITRYAYYHYLGKFISAHPRHFASIKSVLDVSGSLELLKLVGHADLFEVESVRPPQVYFPDSGLASSSYNLVVCDQVLEHIKGSPWDVAVEFHRLLQSGGLVMLTTCFAMPLHPTPSDYLRFSQESLHEIFSSAGFDVLECSGWGNRLVWFICEQGFRWNNVPRNPANPINQIALQREDGFDIITWIIARKR